MRTRTSGVRATATALAIAVVASGVAACAGEEPAAPEAHLEITTSRSSDVVTVNATEGSETTLSSPYLGDDGVDLEVESVDGDEIEIGTSESLSPVNEGGGINLNDLQSEFTATKGEELQIATPTTDGGERWTITVEPGPAPS